MLRFFLVFTLLCVAMPVTATVRLNELLINVPGGSDEGLEYFELLSTTGGVESLDGLTFIAIDGDPTVRGRLDEAISLDGLSTGTNGFFLWAEDDLSLNPTPPTATPVSRGPVNMENDTNTIALVRGFTGIAKETDLDTNDDGILDIVPWTDVVDVIGWIEGNEFGNVSSYSAQLGGTQFTDTHLSGNFPPDGFTPDALFRPAGYETWVGMDVEAPLPFTFSSNEMTRPDGSQLALADFTNNILTPGAPNVTFNFPGSNAGDYNNDSSVDAADYTVWRDAQGTFVAPFSGADGDGSGEIDGPDLSHWQEHYGDVVSTTTSVPEPTGMVLILATTLLGGIIRSRR